VVVDPVDPQADAGTWLMYLNVPFWIAASDASHPSMGSVEMEPSPTVLITGPQGVAQNGSDTFTVTYTGLGDTITLELSTAANATEATFLNGATSTTLTFPPGSNQQQEVRVQGVQASTTADDITITGYDSGYQLASQQFTVVSVAISLNTGVPIQNDAELANFQYLVEGPNFLQNTGLGAELFYNSGEQPQSCAVGTELVGAVSPSNYAGPVTLRRTVVSSAAFQGQAPNQTPGVLKPPGSDDTSAPSLIDDVVGAGGAGQVFDLDPPSIAPGTLLNAPQRLRINFQEYAVLGDRTSTMQVGASLFYYVAVSCGGTPGVPTLDYSASLLDNTAAPSAIPLTWNLQ
jgi:hypothetical protein